jgi:c-di-GMP-binding flagellar brake protein YcgR
MTISRYLPERKFPRYVLDVRAKLIVDEQEITVRTLDISEGGVGLVSPVEILTGSSYAVELVFPTMQNAFRAQLEHQSKVGFRYGFQFVGLDENNLALLRRFQRRWAIRATADYAAKIDTL